MIYRDPIYGKIKIEDSVILKLIKSSTLQRLKGLPQLGYTSGYYPQAPHTRFEHSLGVFILLKKFGASLKEQIAGLIHDASHTVFCHMEDYIFDSGSQKYHTFQDSTFKEFIFNTRIPSILRKYKFNTDYILNEKNFSLKEKPLPDLCADRIDYFLRDSFYFKTLSKKEIQEILDNFEIVNNCWVFKSLKIAKKFAVNYRKLNNLYWSGIKAALMFGTVSEVIKYGLKKNYLDKKDIFTTDKEVLRKLERFRKKDKRLSSLLKMMQGKIKYQLDRKNYKLHIFTKSRAVDPLIKENNQIKRLSEINKSWKRIVKEDSKPKEYFINFLD